MNNLTNGINRVSGTLNRIAVTSGKAPAIDISPSYVGQTSITSLGTVSVGTWNATTIARVNGGTGLTSSGALGAVLTSDGTNWTASTNAPITIQGTLTNSQIKNLSLTPITIIPGQGVGRVIRIIIASAKLNYGTSVFVASVAQTIVINYTGSIAIQATLLPNAQIVASASQFCLPILVSSFSTNAIVDNQGLRLRNSIATEISGNAGNDSTISYSITYQVLQI